MLWRAVMSGAGPAPWWGLDLLSHATSSSGCSEPAGVWSYRLRMLAFAGGYGVTPPSGMNPFTVGPKRRLLKAATAWRRDPANPELTAGPVAPTDEREKPTI
jgi:hypothetical protein